MTSPPQGNGNGKHPPVDTAPDSLPSPTPWGGDVGLIQAHIERLTTRVEVNIHMTQKLDRDFAHAVTELRGDIAGMQVKLAKILAILEAGAP